MQRTKSAAAGSLPVGVEIDIPLERILPDDIKTRPIDEKKVQEMMESFKSKGQQQSIKVHPYNDGYFYKVTFGEHRTEAAKRLGWKTIRGVVQDTDEFETLELKVTENAHRNGFVDPWEEGRIFAKLLQERYDGDLNALAKAIGKSTPYIKDRTLVFHNLNPSLRQYVGNRLTVANTVSLARYDLDHQMKLANVLIQLRTSGPMGFGGGAGGRMLDGRFAPATRVVTYHECSCSCGNVHKDLKYQMPIDPSEETVGVKVIIGSRKGPAEDVYHLENPENGKVSYCGHDLKEAERWAVELPASLDTRTFRIGNSALCDLCTRAWRRAR